jgi:hypothetical protein
MNSPKNWQAIQGEFKFKPNQIEFIGGKAENPKTGCQTAKAGLAMSNILFSGGKIRAKLKLSPSEAMPSLGLVIFRNPANNTVVVAGLEANDNENPGQSRFTIALLNTVTSPDKFEYLATSGWAHRDFGDELTLEVSVRGSFIDLAADGVQVLRHVANVSLPVSQCGVGCQSEGRCVVTDFGVENQLRTAFVVMQFTEPFQKLFAEVIKPVAEECGIKAEKADDVYGPGLIIADVARMLQEADVIIADISAPNENVFYEVGFAHAIRKPTILLAERGKKLPFDVSGFRTLFYENTIAGKSQIEEGLRKHLKAIITDRTP